MTVTEALKLHPEKSNKEIAEITGVKNTIVATMRSRIKRREKGDAGTPTMEALKEECDRAGIPVEDVSQFWYKSEAWSIFSKKSKGLNFFDLRDTIIEDMKKYAPVYPSIEYKPHEGGHLLVIDPADIHIGKLCRSFETGEEYNSQVAVSRVREGVHGILQKVQGFQFDKVLLIIGNDMLHVDTPTNTTTSGTPQNTEGMWYDNFLVGKQIYIEIIETLLQIAPVSVQYDPSNHDYTNGFFLADSLSSWFSKCENVSFNTTIAHRKYFVYGQNLIGTTHGDGAKETDLALLMAHEASKSWATCRHRYFYTHHIHHKKSKDYMSVSVESLRSPSGADSWHHRNGYQHAPKAVEGYIHHPEHGQICRITHLF